MTFDSTTLTIATALTTFDPTSLSTMPPTSSIQINPSSFFNVNQTGNQLNAVLNTYTGDLSACLANCSNQGICTLNSAQKFVCQCNQYKTGSSCQIDTRPCITNPCLNNGTCYNINNETSFQCSCQSNIFYGVYCENMADLCKNSTICFNNQGYCIMNGTQAMCKCKKDYSGVSCEISSVSLAVTKKIIDAATIIVILVFVFLIFLILFLDYTKYFTAKKQKSIKKSQSSPKIKFYYQP
jgi:hypothetical protein